MSADERRRRRSWSRLLLADLAVVLGAFVLVSLLAGLAGAVNTGTAITFGQIGFVVALVLVLLRR